MLRRRQLHAIQVNVHDGEQNDRDKVMETYTFAIRYQADDSGVKSPTSVEIIGSDIPQATDGQVNEGLRTILKSISGLCDELPRLPGLCLRPCVCGYYSLRSSSESLRVDRTVLPRG